RHDFRLARIEREKAAKAARHKQKRAAVSDGQGLDKKKSAIAAALARVQAKKQNAEVTPQNTTELTAAQQMLIDATNKRRSQKVPKEGSQ
ncbi:MAG: hypothetical protein ACC707_08035, partial [Thiohalomonadales bacterium]